MDSIARTITGIILMLLGFVFLVVAFFKIFISPFFGIVFLVIGLIIFLNKSEDKIEQRKDIKNKKGKK